MLRARLVSAALLIPWGLAVAASLSASGCGWFDTYPAPCPVDAGNGGAGGFAGASGTTGDSGADGPVCGDGIVSGSEECDNGTANAKGSGCETDCHFSCHADADCDDGDPCNGAETCQAVAGGQACKAGTPAVDNTTCGTGGYCKSGVCTQPVCGNGTVEPGEDCEPPGTATCSDKCKNVVCGDGVIAGNEQCDDGNTKNLDGCDSNCNYETVMRFTSFNITRDPAPAYCVNSGNAIGTSFSAAVAQAFDANIQATIDGGTYNELLVFGGLDDLTGTNSTNFSLGLVSGSRDPAYTGTWKTDTLDEWYLADTGTMGVDAVGIPNQRLSPAAIASGVLTAGPSRVAIGLTTGTTSSAFDVLDTRVSATLGSSTSVPAAPPSALASGLKVFEGLDAMASDQGLCGAATVASLAQIPLPQDFCLGPNACESSSNCAGSHSYTYCGAGLPVTANCSSLLDVIVGGCKATSLCIQAVTPAQPDVGTNGNSPAPLSLDANNKANPTVPTDAYTFFAHFKGVRAHLTNNLN